MSFFQKQTFVAVDLETTGVNVETDRIIEFAGILVEDGKIVKQLEFVIDPQMEISPQVQAITGITNAEVQGKPTFAEVKKQIQEFVDGHIIVGHNIMFDINFLEKHGVQTTQKYLDTYTLCSLFFHEEKSLALEVLSENLQIEHKYKHRALGDILATVELLKIIHQKIQELPLTTLTKIQDFLQEKATPLKSFFFDVNSKQAAQVDEKFSKESAFVPGQNSELKEILQKSFQDTGNSLLEIPHQYNTILEAINLLEGKNTLAFYSPKLLNKVVDTISSTETKDFCVLKNISNYLCLQKFDKFLNKEALSETETALAIKLIIWLEKTTKGDRDEIALTYDDYAIWYKELSSNDSCSGSEHADCFWHKNKKLCQESNLVITYHNLLVESHLPTDRKLMICEARDLEKSLTNFGTQRITLDDFVAVLNHLQKSYQQGELGTITQSIAENLQLLWGYLHRELTQDLTEFIYPQKIIFSNSLKTHAGFLGLRKRFKEIFVEIEELLTKLDTLNQDKFSVNQLRTLTQDIQTFFDELHENEIRFFHAFPSGELNLQINTIDLKILTSEIINKYEQVICLDENLGTVNGNNEYTFDYWKQSLGLQDTLWEEKRLIVPVEEKANVDLSFLMSKPDNQNIFERTCELIKETVLNNQGRTLVLFTSYASINTYFGTLGLELQELGYKVLPQGGGGVKKIKAIFEQFPDKSVIFGIERSYHREFFDLKDLKTVILQKLVFDFPGDPLVKARQEKYGNSFMDFSLPRSILSFKQNYLKLQSNSQNFVPLDTRLTEKRYGQYFLESIK